MRYFYFILCHFFIKNIQLKLVKIVVKAGRDVQIFSTLTANELYIKMRDVYSTGVRTVKTASEMKELYQALHDLNKELKRYLHKAK